MRIRKGLVPLKPTPLSFSTLYIFLYLVKSSSLFFLLLFIFLFPSRIVLLSTLRSLPPHPFLSCFPRFSCLPYPIFFMSVAGTMSIHITKLLIPFLQPSHVVVAIMLLLCSVCLAIINTFTSFFT
ncbi:hypothetical protein BKA57DRAFT_21350 [Linnemannia elongata]|nr:hypothetical protein BKA57DRAFT_21350 [Linnemannia elongata]